MIEFKNVDKKYNRITALEDINFHISKGEFVCLVGPSGAGKSTVIRLLTCEEKPTTGKIYIAGKNIVNLNSAELPHYRRRIGVVFQDFKLLPQKTVYENVAYALEVCDASNSEIKKRVPLMLELVGLQNRAGNYPHELSGGERQRVSIARAMIHSPKLLIADEPTGNLDPVNTWEIIDLLKKINQRGTIIILATHDKEIVDKLRTRVVTVKAGKLVADMQRGQYLF